VAILGVLCAVAPARAQSLTLPATIPIFPLPDILVYPNLYRPLYIFEPRYRAMVADALQGDRIIGMVLLRPGFEADYDGRPPVYEIGCAGVIEDVEQLPLGEYNIVLRGLMRFRIVSEDESRSYRLARVEALPETFSADDRMELRVGRERLIELLTALAPGRPLPPASLPDEDLVNAMAQNSDFDPVEQQRLLERDGPLARFRMLVDLLEPRVTAPR
jgi:hypothetical protein